MDRIADILVIIDPTAASQPAVDKAAILASHLNASIEILACDTKVSHDLRLSRHASDWGARDFTISLQPMLDLLAAPLRAQGLDVATHVISGDPLYESVLAFLHDSTADLVIKDTHHHSLVKRTFITNTDWHLIRECPLPLLLCKSKPWAKRPVYAAAIDPDHVNMQSALLDRRILDCAAELAKHTNAEVHAVHAYFPSLIAAAVNSSTPSLLTVSPEMVAAEMELNRSKAASLTAQYSIPADRLHVDMGVPAEYLPRIAQECHADIMVMGAISRSHLQQALIGSTAERVLEYLPCDVLVIKAPKFGQYLPF